MDIGFSCLVVVVSVLLSIVIVCCLLPGCLDFNVLGFHGLYKIGATSLVGCWLDTLSEPTGEL